MNLTIPLFVFISLIMPSALNAVIASFDQDSNASDIVIGQVMSVKKTLDNLGHGSSDLISTVRMIVTKVIKSEEINPGQEVKFTYRRIHERPHGWCGPIKQNHNVKPFKNIRAYMIDVDNRYELLEPNGFNEE